MWGPVSELGTFRRSMEETRRDAAGCNTPTGPRRRLFLEEKGAPAVDNAARRREPVPGAFWQSCMESEAAFSMAPLSQKKARRI